MTRKCSIVSTLNKIVFQAGQALNACNEMSREQGKAKEKNILLQAKNARMGVVSLSHRACQVCVMHSTECTAYKHTGVVASTTGVY
jgi:hypothetical protein